VVAVVLVALVLAVVGAAAATSSTNTNRSLDPDGVGPSGVKGLREVLERSGAEVAVSSAPLDDQTDVALVLNDAFDDERVKALDTWVRSGHTLVVTEPSLVARGVGIDPDQLDNGDNPALDPMGGGFVWGTELTRARCDIDALAAIDRISVDSTSLLAPEFGDHRCFGGEQTGTFVATLAAGAGTVVVLGGPSPLVNANLDKADNAGLAVALLAPVVGTRLTFVEPRIGEAAPVRSGPDAVVRRALSGMAGVVLAQLAVAFGLYAWWRGRRVGRPVAEPLPVAISGSELTEAVGNLLARTGQPDRAAQVLRRELRRDLTRSIGLAADAPIDAVAEAAARTSRGTVRPDEIATALSDIPVVSDDALVALSALIDRIREETLHGVPA
jgi:hypothetical protein